MTLSIIIPVYNTEATLPLCIDSILSQSFTDFELLLVDDGSKDGSRAVCDRYAEKDSRVRVFHQKNGGCSSARNKGLDHVSGEWVYFVDSDDVVLPGGLQTLVDCIREDVDIVMAGFERSDEDGNIFYRVEDRITTLFDKRESLSTLYERYEKYYDYLGYCWMRLFRNRIIQKYHLRFDTDIRIKEDSLFIVQYLCRSNGVTVFTLTPVYKYCMRKDSLMGEYMREINDSFVDPLFSLQKMKHEIASCFSPCSELVFIANEGIWIRYHKLLARMRKHGISDDGLRRKMESIVKKELKFGFFVRKKLRKIKRIMQGWCSERKICRLCRTAA